jgi:tetratricopeptide (TPR) repeat protein
MDADQLFAAAEGAFSEGLFGQAEEHYRAVTHVQPTHVRAQVMLGVLATRAGRANDAITRFERARGLDPDSFDATMYLAIAYQKSGRRAEALALARRAVELNPDSAHAQNELGLYLQQDGLLEEAERHFEEAARLSPKAAHILLNLSTCRQRQGRTQAAKEAVTRGLRIIDRPPDGLVSLASKLITDWNAEGAVEVSRQAVRMAPSSAPARVALVRALLGSNRTAEAQSALNEAVRAPGRDPETVMQLGMALQAVGRLEEAEKYFRTSIQLKPEQGAAYWALCNTRKLKEADRPLIAQMERAVAGQLTLPDAGSLQYGLGKAYEDLGEYERAMGHYDEANRLRKIEKFGDRPMDRDHHTASIDAVISSLSKEKMDEYSGFGRNSEVPIFVMGMMRSGTTLVESILSSHSRVGAAGEQPFWIFNRFDGTDPSLLSRMADNYVGYLASISPNTDRVVDKMPTNNWTLGTIHLALPNARIIHTRRRPIDNCLSIWTTANTQDIAFAHDRENIMFGYREFARLRAHWRTVIPSDRLLEIDYEELTADPEPVVRQMLDFCGLDWEDQCLSPERNPRAILTPSVLQVRQPINTGSVERWRRFEPWLGAFRELL